MIDVIKLLQQIGLSRVQAEIFFNLYRFGAKPASSIAKMIGAERTNTYKILQTMVRNGYVAETLKSGVKHFFLADKNILRSKIEQDQRELTEKYDILPKLEAELIKLDDKRIFSAPKIRFFEGKNGIINLFDDMYVTINKEKYISIKMFASNTLESQSMSQQKLHTYTEIFFDKIKKDGITVDAYVGNGILMLESLFQTQDIQEIMDLPAGHSSINLFIVGTSVFLSIYKQTPFGLKIESEELADMFYFLFKLLSK